MGLTNLQSELPKSIFHEKRSPAGGFEPELNRISIFSPISAAAPRRMGRVFDLDSNRSPAAVTLRFLRPISHTAIPRQVGQIANLPYAVAGARRCTRSAEQETWTLEPETLAAGGVELESNWARTPVNLRFFWPTEGAGVLPARASSEPSGRRFPDHRPTSATKSSKPGEPASREQSPTSTI